MFGIGAYEMIVILVLALLIFGPQRLPELARQLGRGMAELRRASNELRRSMNVELDAHKIERPPGPAQAVPDVQATPDGPAAPMAGKVPTTASSPLEAEGAVPTSPRTADRAAGPAGSGADDSGADESDAGQDESEAAGRAGERGPGREPHDG